MNSNRRPPFDLGRLVKNQLHMTDRLVMDFGQSVSPGHVKMWINHLIGNVQRRKRVIIKADTLLITDKGMVVVTGKNISMIGGGEVMDGLDAPIVVKGPKPKFPDPNELGSILIELKGRTLKVKDVISDKIGSVSNGLRTGHLGMQ